MQRMTVSQTKRNRRAVVLAIAVCFAIGVLGPVPSFATSFLGGFGLSEGSVLPNYTIVSVGPTASIKVNSGPIDGNVLLGQGTASSSSGGGNGQVTGRVDYDASAAANGDLLTHIQIPPTLNQVSSALTLQAFNDANTLAQQAAAKAATQTYGAISGAFNIVGNGGLNVINVQSLHNPDFTITGNVIWNEVLK